MTILTKQQRIENIYLGYCGCLPEPISADYNMLIEAYDFGYEAGQRAGVITTQSPAEQINNCDYLSSLYGKQN